MMYVYMWVGYKGRFLIKKWKNVFVFFNCMVERFVVLKMKVMFKLYDSDRLFRMYWNYMMN